LNEANTINITEVKSYDDHQSEVGSLKQIVAGSKKFIQKLKDLEGTCPTCEQPVDEELKQKMLEEERSKGQAAVARIKELEETINEIKESNRLFERKQKIERDWNEIFRSIDESLPSSPLDKGELEERLARVQDDLDGARAKLAEVSKENERRTRRNTRIQVIQEQTEEFTDQLNEQSSKLEELRELSSSLEVLKKAFSTNGLVAYKIENLVKELEELVNSYLGELSDGRFTLEFVVSNDKLNVEITDNGNIVDILALSSGELARVNTATLLAIRRLMSSISKSRINVLFLDEVINVLDETGREKMVEVLLEESLNTYIVSHGWTHPLLEKVEVIKCDNVSRLEH
jgi:DNA repair exonuclease SbcCD ATPase subunit